jgi:hypothetical protein
MRGGDVAHVVEHLPSELKALNSIPSTTTKKSTNVSM